MNDDSKLLPALLKFWRGRRGLSQLDLALAAGVSTRHVSFLETGRSRASAEMILTLAATLDVPLRERNVMLRAAGFPAVFPELGIDALVDDPGLKRAAAHMMQRHNPYPMLFMNRWYEVLRMNEGAECLLRACLKRDVPRPFNGFSAFFDPELLRPYLVDWRDVAREMVSRLHRESLHRPYDTQLSELLDEVLHAPGVPESWRHPDFSRTADAAFVFRFRLGPTHIAFLTTLTTFNAPQNVTLDELQIESYFPLDEVTERVCTELVTGGTEAIDSV